MNNIGGNIKKLRKNAKLTQEQLAKLTNLSTMSIRRYENGERDPKTKDLKKIAIALQIDFIDIIKNSNDDIDLLNYIDEERNYLNNIDDKLCQAFVNLYSNIGYNYTFCNDKNEVIFDDGKQSFTVDESEVERFEDDMLSYFKYKFIELKEKNQTKE